MSGFKVPGECRGITGERTGVQSARGMQGNAGKHQGKVLEWV